jgi:TRAP-type C4-dicarboxylate transport system permease small subunit
MVDIKEENGKSTTTLVIETIVGLMTAAFGFVAALAWNDAIQTVISTVFPAEGDPTGKLIYAVIITIIAVIAIILISRVLAKYQARDKKKSRK